MDYQILNHKHTKEFIERNSTANGRREQLSEKNRQSFYLVFQLEIKGFAEALGSAIKGKEKGKYMKPTL
jgi:hypothetical protein